jgi:hypothetical protein
MVYQNISSNIGKNDIDTGRSAREGLIVYLDERLPGFPSFLKKRSSAKKIVVEKKISRELCLFLNDIGNPNKISLFHFYPEWDYEDSHRSSDLAVIDVGTYKNSSSPTETFFVIEAKRLPTGSGREKEYVEGNLGGIERYKKGHHGVGLTESAMVGYIQDENKCSYWKQQINKWISDLIKSNTEKDICWNSHDLLLLEKDFINIHRYSSKNSRIVTLAKDSIKLHHYLMELI